jgi:deazaflavin-dependent oxidoreductase (nitroreductase family)
VSEINDFNQQMIENFRANNGQVSGFASLVILTTTGAKSGLARTTPVACLVDDDGTLYVCASKAGAPTNPDWYHNLVANPTITVEFGAETFEATAEPITGAKRDEIYAKQVEQLPVFAEYQSKTDRVIPVVALRRG